MCRMKHGRVLLLCACSRHSEHFFIDLPFRMRIVERAFSPMNLFCAVYCCCCPRALCVVLWRTLCIRFSNSQLFNFHLVRASNYINIYREIYRVYHPNVYRFVNASNATNFRHPRGGEIRPEHTSLIRISIYLSLMNFSFVKRRGFWRGRASELYQHNHIDDPAKETHTHTLREWEWTCCYTSHMYGTSGESAFQKAKVIATLIVINTRNDIKSSVHKNL